MKDLFITNVKENEIDDVARLYVKVYTRFLPNEKWTFDSAKKFIAYNFKKSPTLFFVAKNKEKIIGFSFGYIKPWSDGAHLMCEELVVDYDFHKNGVGKKLFKILINTAYKEYNATSIDASTYLGESEMPFLWYNRIGFNKEKKLFLIYGKTKTIIKNLKK